MIDSLRIHAAGEPAPRHGGGHVLYWMQSSFRARENHALDFAIEQVNALRVPLVVYHGLRHDYPWANDRFHTFLLETAADLHGEFEALGIQYALYLEREGDDAAARRAAGRPSPYGTVRYMSLAAAAKKFDVGKVIRRYPPRSAA